MSRERSGIEAVNRTVMCSGLAGAMPAAGVVEVAITGYSGVLFWKAVNR
jgi:hypothetical protein